MGKARHDLDMAWKEALTAFLPDFLALFHPEAHGAIDWSQPPVFLESELRRLHRGLPGTRKGRRMHVDLLARVRLRAGAEALVLIHVEVQSQHDPHFEVRMSLYHHRLFDRYRVPVFSVAVLADSHPNWRPDHHETGLWGCVSSFRFPVVKLLDWRERRAELEASSNPFALVVAAHLAVLETRPDQPARLLAALRLVRLLVGGGFSQETISGLFDVLVAMMTLSGTLATAFDEEVARLEEEAPVRLLNRYDRRARREGLREGRQEGLRSSVQAFCEARFGLVSAELVEALAAVADPKALERLARKAATVSSPEEFLEAVRAEGRPG